jgi:hypothetical protein
MNITSLTTSANAHSGNAATSPCGMRCAQCGKHTSTSCDICNWECYCSKECQSSNQKAHYKKCNEIAAKPDGEFLDLSKQMTAYVKYGISGRAVYEGSASLLVCHAPESHTTPGCGLYHPITGGLLKRLVQTGKLSSSDYAQIRVLIEDEKAYPVIVVTTICTFVSNEMDYTAHRTANNGTILELRKLQNGEPVQGFTRTFGCTTSYLESIKVNVTNASPKAAAAHAARCAQCKKPADRKCTRCREDYCSRECQKKHWKSGHKNRCTPLGVDTKSIDVDNEARPSYVPDTCSFDVVGCRNRAIVDAQVTVCTPGCTDGQILVVHILPDSSERGTSVRLWPITDEALSRLVGSAGLDARIAIQIEELRGSEFPVIVLICVKVFKEDGKTYEPVRLCEDKTSLLLEESPREKQTLPFMNVVGCDTAYLVKLGVKIEGGGLLNPPDICVNRTCSETAAPGECEIIVAPPPDLGFICDDAQHATLAPVRRAQ